MPTKRLDNRVIRAAMKEARRVELWDTVEPGLHVLVTVAGAATFYVRYRTSEGRRRLKVGRYGRLTIDQARRSAKGILADVERWGRSPKGSQRGQEGHEPD